MGGSNSLLELVAPISETHSMWQAGVDTTENPASSYLIIYTGEDSRFYEPLNSSPLVS